MLQILILDKSVELESADLKAYIESLGVQDYLSVAYEQYQNGLAESSINSIMLMIICKWLGQDWLGSFGIEH